MQPGPRRDVVAGVEDGWAEGNVTFRTAAFGPMCRCLPTDAAPSSAVLESRPFPNGVTMSSLTQLLLSQLGDRGLSSLGESLGSDPEATKTAATAALPLLFSALAKNASTTEGATALDRALDRDHDGSVLDGITDALSGGTHAAEGDGILKHVLGSQRAEAETGIAKLSGLDAGQRAQMLATLAPLVMGTLGKAKRSRGLNAEGLAGLLGSESGQARSQLGGLAGLLDRDGDGSVADDVLGGLGKLLGGR